MSAQANTIPRPKVLFIDDEQRVLNSMRIMFRRDYELYFANDGQEALEVLEAQDIDVIVCDHRMPQMTGVELLARAKVVSPRSVRILLTGYADLNAVEGSINEGEVFRFLTKPCAPEELKETVLLAANLALDPEANPEAYEMGDSTVAEEAFADIVLSEDSPPTPETGRKAPGTSTDPAEAAPQARPVPRSFDRTSTQIIEKPLELEPGQRRKVVPARAKQPARGFAVLVFTTDDEIFEVVRDSVRGRVPLHRATNIVQVVKILNEHKPGVLLTDISEDKQTIQAMTARLKEHLPQLVTIAVSEHRDVLDMVWLINHGQIFRFLRKPLSPGRCAVSLKAALQHHENLLKNPALVKRHAVQAPTEQQASEGILSKLSFLRKLKLWAPA